METTAPFGTTRSFSNKGTIYAFRKKYGYGVRSLVETQIFRIKRCIGETLLTQKIEDVIIASLINL